MSIIIDISDAITTYKASVNKSPQELKRDIETNVFLQLRTVNEVLNQIESEEELIETVHLAMESRNDPHVVSADPGCRFDADLFNDLIINMGMFVPLDRVFLDEARLVGNLLVIDTIEVKSQLEET